MSTHDEHAAHAEGKDHHHHITPLPVYFAVFGALMVLTAVTVWIAQFHFGAANTLVAMLVATIKASLVALIFMHLLYDERLNAVAFGFGLIFVALFFIFTLADVMTRGYIDPVRAPGVIHNERVAALRLEYEKQFPAQSAFQPAAPGAGLPADERPSVVPDPSLAPGATPGAEGASPVEGAVPGVDGADGAEGGVEGAAPGDGTIPPAGAAPAEGVAPGDGIIPPAGAADGVIPPAEGAAPAEGAVAAPAGEGAAAGEGAEDDERVPGDAPPAREPTRPAQPGGNVPGQQPQQPRNQPPIQEP